MKPYMSSFVEYLCLCYHEARNVRHLVKDGHLPSQPFELLRVLPTNRTKAWQELAPLRAKAEGLDRAEAASDLFAARFECSIEQLIDLYGDPHWRSSAYGGNPWAGITSAVRALQRAIDGSETGEASRLAGLLPEMRHNTGTVGEKLNGLNRAARGG